MPPALCPAVPGFASVRRPRSAGIGEVPIAANTAAWYRPVSVGGLEAGQELAQEALEISKVLSVTRGTPAEGHPLGGSVRPALRVPPDVVEVHGA